MVKWIVTFALLFTVGLLLSSLTLGNSGNDCKHLVLCQGESCEHSVGHFVKCAQLTIPSVSIPLPTTTVNVPTATVPTITEATTEPEPEHTDKKQKQDKGATITPPTPTPPSVNVPSPSRPRSIPITKIPTENALKTAGTNFAFSIVGFIVGLLVAWLWCLRSKT